MKKRTRSPFFLAVLCGFLGASVLRAEDPSDQIVAGFRERVPSSGTVNNIFNRRRLYGAVRTRAWNQFLETKLFESGVIPPQATLSDVREAVDLLREVHGYEFPRAYPGDRLLRRLRSTASSNGHVGNGVASNGHVNGAAQPARVAPPDSFVLEVPRLTYLLPTAGAFVRTEDGDYYMEDGVPKAVLRRFNSRSGRSARPRENLEDNRPAWLPMWFTKTNTLHELVFDRARPVRVDLASKVSTPKQFEQVVHLLAQTVTGRAGIYGLLGTDTIGKNMRTAIDVFHDEGHGFRFKAIKAFPARTVNRASPLRPRVLVQVQYERQSPMLVTFLAGAEVGQLAVDLLHALVTDLPTGVSMQRVLTDFETEANFAGRTYQTRRSFYTASQAHTEPHEFYRELQFALADSRQLENYFRSREAKRELFYVTNRIEDEVVTSAYDISTELLPFTHAERIAAAESCARLVEKIGPSLDNQTPSDSD